MEEIKKKKWIKAVIIAVIAVLLLVCVCYVIFPVRASPAETYEAYEEFANELKGTEFITPSKELLPVDITGLEIVYMKNRRFPNSRWTAIFDARGLFPNKGRYSIYVGEMSQDTYEEFTLTATRTDIKDYDYSTNPTSIPKREPIQGIKESVDEYNYNRLIFQIGDVIYEISKSDGNDKLTVDDLKAIANDIIQKANEK